MALQSKSKSRCNVPMELDKYDNESYLKNPLLTFHMADVRQRRHFTLLKDLARINKIKYARPPLTDDLNEDVIPIPEKTHAQKIRDCTAMTPVPKMLFRTESKMISYVPLRLRKKYPKIVLNYMTDVHFEFDKIMKAFSLQKILKPLPDDYVPPREEFNYRYLGRTKNYPKFLRRRNQIQRTLVIAYPFIRAILNYSLVDFPNSLNDYGQYRVNNKGQPQWLELAQFEKMANTNLDEGAAFLKQHWYPKIVKIIKKHHRRHTVPKHLWPRIFACAKGLINRQLTELKIRTFEHIYEVILDRERMPFLKLETLYSGQHLDIAPTFRQIFNAFSKIFIDISNVGKNLPLLEIVVDVHHHLAPDESNLLKIEVTDGYMAEAREKLREALIITYDSVLHYLSAYRQDYVALFGTECEDDIRAFLSEERTFEEYFEKIEVFREFITSLRRRIVNDFFDVATVNETHAINGLRKLAQDYIDQITEHIVAAHTKDAHALCEEFTAIKIRAMEIPLTTEMLLANGDYMLEVKTKTIFELQERIKESLRIGGLLIELTELQPDHVALQIDIIRWFREMKKIFEQNASLFESYKSMFEEHLQTVVRKLNEDLEAITPQISVINDMCETEKFREYKHLLSTFNDKLNCFSDYIKWVNKEEKLFKLNVTQYDILEELKNYVVPFAELMDYCVRWVRHYEVWMDGPFEYLVPTFVEEMMENYNKEFQKMQKAYRNRIKQDMIGAPVCRFKGKSEDPDPEKHPVPLRLCNRILNWMKDFKTGAFIITNMCNPALCQRHWDEMSEVAGFDITPDAGTTLRKILNMGLDDRLDAFEIISIGANKELQLQQNLAAMKKEWETLEFPVSMYKDTGIPILSGLDDIQALLDDQIIKTLTMRGSAFVKPCEQEVRDWYDRLVRVNKCIEEWGKVQSNWLYLLPIFSSKDIVAQMPEEGRLFQQVDQTFRRNMGMVQREPLVIETGPAPGILESMEAANVMLEDISNGVNTYLEKKRLYFPRFFFLANDEMLEILSETKDPLRVQPHLGKCFEGIYRLKFDEHLVIQAMLSRDKESIEFVTKISTPDAKGSVEKWLLRVEEEMLIAVRHESGLCYLDYLERSRLDWVCLWPQMIILCISQVFWAIEVHSCLQTKDTAIDRVSEFAKTLTKDLNDVVTLVRSTSITNLVRNTIKSLIVIDVHAKDVIAELIVNKVDSLDDFIWLSQLRYYWEEERVMVRIINATVPLANEYLGNSDRLVITPLTDRCYRTLVGAYQLHLNGAPEGPAGTGKTETTKDLAKALAVQCKVFNCSDGLDYKAMGKFFKGLASAGAWACFDEFNRIELEVLSVVAQQILCIVVAVRNHVVDFVFEGTHLILNPACYVCITMNPGYAGRSELPDNLKVLFRTVAMMVPDYAMIGEISLYSYGFIDARKLAVKIVTTYRLCSEQLSSQNHYDYGMRAVKTVLSACGNIKQAFPEENEDILLLRSLIDVNLPKFLSFDVPLFEGIISDLFPGISLMATDYSAMREAFLEACEQSNLQPEDSFFNKIVQTYEMMIVRHGFMLVGDPFAGKSVTLTTLANILAKLEPAAKCVYHRNCELGIVNPKSITMGQLYGAFDPISYEWTDGIAATIYRQFATDPSEARKWLIFDGPIDAVWIENMNTVLDDNKKLCLTSGEVITMSFEMSMIFEVMDLSQASPATVSRCGMIYMEPITLGWQTFVKSWLNQCSELWVAEHREFIMELFIWVVPTMTSFAKRQCSHLLYPGEFNLLMTTMSIFQMLMDDAVEESPEDYDKFLTSWFQAALVYSVVWGIGGLLNADSRVKFNEVYKQIWDSVTEETPAPGCLKGKIDISIPMEGDFSEYVYIFKQKGAWKYWPDVVRRHDPEISALGIQVSTIDTGRYMHLLKLHIKHKRKVLFCGPTGTGKSFYTQNLLMNTLDEKYVPAFITFTVMITANQTQNLFLSKLNKLKRGIYGPQKGKIAVIFVDDMNMPAKEVYGAQPPIELLRQFFDYKHFYDLKDTSKIFLRDILVLAACGLPGGSRQDVYPRFLCHFNCFSINDFSPETMQRIFNNVLLIGLKKNGHASDVILSVQQIVNATLHVFKASCASLRPTPAKSHYIFNLRDVSRVCLGCSLLRKESVDNKKVFAKIWFHEAMRVFFDRLIEDSDRKWFFDLLSDGVRDFFRDKMELVFDSYLNENGVVTLASVSKLLFSTCMDTDNEPIDRKYEELPSFQKFFEIATTALEDYNSTHKSRMDVVLFSYALEHLNKICRIMSMPAGSALLVGMGGSGRQSLTKLAAAICTQNVFQPEITKNYDMNSWRDDLKKVLRESGGRGKDVVFLFTENQIKLEAFLTDIDCLLNLGEVPNIWPIDEKQEILELVRLAAQGGNRSVDVSPLQVFSYFVNRCKEKLHLILCFSPIGSAFRTRIRLYPSLVNCCTIDWYDAWPSESLEMVANMYMTSVDITDDIKVAIALSCQHFHVTALNISKKFFEDTQRITYITSASYLEMIRSFCSLMYKKQTETMSAKMRYIGGLETLSKAAESVATMQVELNALQPKLIVMAANSKKMSADIEKNTQEASIATEQVKRDELVANEQAAMAEEMEEECSKDLAMAVPVLEEALAALNTLKPADISLVKSMKNPPPVVKLVMAAVCVMKGIAPEKVNDPATGKKGVDYWGPSKRLLSDMGFLQSLKDYDKDNITVDIMKKIRKDFIPHPDFKPQIVAKASSAAEGLCKWIIAMDMYDDVAKVVAPKKAKLYAAKEMLRETKEYLAEKRAMAAMLEEKVAQLNDDLARANAEKQRLEDETELCKNKLERAEKLIGGLGGEKSRWTNAAANLQNLYDKLAGDVMISCGVIAYLAPLTMPFRKVCVDDWHSYCRNLKIPCSEQYNFTEVLGSEIKIQSWNLVGLPRDNFSSENSIIMDNSSRFSLFIDPQEQANIWIKRMEKANRLQVLKFSQGNYMKVLENCLEYGYPALIESILEDIEAPLDPILKMNTFKMAGVTYISLGDNSIPLSPKFRLYLTSNLRNPHYLPETFNKVTIINFSLTKQGLEDQLLGIAVAKERPDLQELREQLVADSARNKAMLSEVETNILQTLSQSKGDILEDETAIQILDDSKIISADIIEKQAASKVTEVQIETFRTSYQPLASHSSTLYYCITDMQNVDPMYQFSLNWYINLYTFSIESANKSKDIARRLKFLMDAITQNLYNNVCRSIFEKDKLLFSLILTTKILLASQQIDRKAFEHLLVGSSITELPTKENPAPQWISDKMWNEIFQLKQLSIFSDFLASVLNNLSAWRHYYDVSNPHMEPMPVPWDKKTTMFEKLLILRAFRPDKLASAIREYVFAEMGASFVTPPQFDIAKSYDDSNCLTPLVFILSPGADPMGSLLLFAEKMGRSEVFHAISLGQGQGPIARKLIEEAQLSGGWVCLQNCHLAASWMPVLVNIWENMDLFNTNNNFRLWLTSYPSTTFPPTFLQNGVKMTNEPPTGLQQNLLRSYMSEPINDRSFYEGCPGNDRAFSRILYGICFFHALVQERKKFGALGWNIMYEFNDSDLHISVRQLQMFLNQYEKIPYTAICYLTGECNYGGRVTDAWDRRLIVSILSGFVNYDVVNDLSYRFADDKMFVLPRNVEHREVVKYIGESLPNAPSPEVYGLHPNAGITRDLNMSTLLLETMTMTQEVGGSASQGGGDSTLGVVVQEIVRKLPADFDIEVCEGKYPIDYNESMNTVLIQEMKRFNKLLAVIRVTCIDLVKSIDGIIIQTPELESIAGSISIKKTPKEWMKFSYPSLKPVASYIQDFCDRLEWLQRWYDVGKPNTFWLPGFFFTQAFLTAAMQNFARKYKIPIDTLCYDFKVLPVFETKSLPDEGVFVHGCFLDGSRWNLEKRSLDEQLPKVLVSAMPIIHLVPGLVVELIEGGRYKCPMYKTAERKGILSTTGHSTNYVLFVLLKTLKPASHWIKRSAAMICQTND